ncbi:MAG: glycoside hydrolase family 2, partial [Clostridiales bacterium]|nr:glycoside hydrolase family 2 [Clostridiales bacterium]
VITAGEDRVESYFALRVLSVKQVNGVSRLCLNEQPYFFHGLLDQGYFSDGIYLPASLRAYQEDILNAKAMGFNTLRKHIKIEPALFYALCDRLGMVVFQDMVNNGKYSFLRDTALPTLGAIKLSDRFIKRTIKQKDIFLHQMNKTMDHLHCFPSICYWTIFNEGWGQFEADRVFQLAKQIDSSRFIDATSGWFWQKHSDVDSYHVYFKPVRLPVGSRPLVLSEFGGYSYNVPNHCFNSKKTHGYKKLTSEQAYEAALVTLYEKEIIPSIPSGLCASIYTQISDVEDETNGLFTYDRQHTKVQYTSMMTLREKIDSALRSSL